METAGGVQEMLGMVARIVRDEGTAVSSVLAPVHGLAQQAGVDAVEQWADFERFGYPPDALVPTYRVRPALAYGTFKGPAGEVADFALPAWGLPDHLRIHGEQLLVRLPLTELERVALGAHGPAMRVTWPAPVLDAVADRMMLGYRLLEAHQDLQVSDARAILAMLRHRLDAFVLAVLEDAGGERDALDAVRVLRRFEATVGVRVRL